MKNNTSVILGLIGIGLYLYLKKQAPVQLNTTTNLPPTTPVPKVAYPVKTEQVLSKTKDCEITYYNCDGSSRKEIIQIPINDDCNKYQPALPNCAPPQRDEFQLMPINFNI